MTVSAAHEMTLRAAAHPADVLYRLYWHIGCPFRPRYAFAACGWSFWGVRIRPGPEVEHGDGHRKTADRVRRLAGAIEELPSATSDVLLAAGGMPGRRESRGVCRDGRETFYRCRRLGGIVDATLRIPCYSSHKLALVTTITWQNDRREAQYFQQF